MEYFSIILIRYKPNTESCTFYGLRGNLIKSGILKFLFYKNHDYSSFINKNTQIGICVPVFVKPS